MSLWGRNPFLAVRILGTDGNYPRFSLRSATHRYEASDGLVWTAVVQQPLPEDWETSENPTLIPEEIRLHASLTFSEGDPWHAPILQPAFVRAASVPFLKLIGAGCSNPVTVTSMRASLPEIFAMTWAAPLASG